MQYVEFEIQRYYFLLTCTRFLMIFKKKFFYAFFSFHTASFGEGPGVRSIQLLIRYMLFIFHPLKRQFEMHPCVKRFWKFRNFHVFLAKFYSRPLLCQTFRQMRLPIINLIFPYSNEKFTRIGSRLRRPLGFVLGSAYRSICNAKQRTA
ncbi:MAG: hypothetical protein LBL94_04120, partial [Prevotellaceae bacterium]|nr:hypothetical protein [Prevotellaceae bacterium]